MSEFNPQISYFKNAKSNVPFPGKPSITSMLGFIQGGTYKKEVEAVRAAATKEERDELKKNLHAITWSGTFTKRNSKSLEQYSQIICIDIDHLDASVSETKERLRLSDIVYACFVSPSGEGLKALFRTDITSVDQFPEAWQAIANYLEKTYGIEADVKCKDICRLCFVSYDPDLYINEAAHPVEDEFIRLHNAKQDVKPEPAPATVDLFQKCHEITQKTQKAERGSYNAYINVYAIQALRYDLPESDVIRELKSYCSDHDEKDTEAVVKNVYSHEKELGPRGKYNTPSRSTGNRTGKKAHSDDVQAPATGSGIEFDDSVVFWFGVEPVADKETGEIVGYKDYKYSYDDAMQFLQNNGFYKYKFDNDNYQLIHVDLQHHIVEIVTELRIYEFMLAFLKSNPSPEYKKVREMFRRGAKNYCSSYALRGLSYYTPKMKRDTRDTAFVYFKNVFIEITNGKEPAVKKYTELDEMIWRKQIIDFEYAPGEHTNCDFSRFLWYAITGRVNTEGNPYNEQECNKVTSVMTTIGYLLHRYKSPATTKAVVSVDKKIRRTGEANGRSGKSLFSKALGKMLNMVIIDGPNYKPDYEFALQQVNIDTELINFNDVTKNFDFTRLFGMITEELTFNKKKIDSITIPFADAPKFYISTNFTLKGDGESNKGRQQIIEFSTFFNTENTPAKVFGRMFFYDWDADEWNKFYSFFIHCIKLYMESGLLDFPLENYHINKLIDTAGEDFVDFMDEHVKEALSNNSEQRRFEIKPLFEKYREISRKHELRQNTFTRNVKMWAAANELEVNKNYQDGRCKSNGVDYYEFTAILKGDIPF